ncbi:hypothetical protein ACP4OV_027160 [Aristida adscensionis]
MGTVIKEGDSLTIIFFLRSVPSPEEEDIMAGFKCWSAIFTAGYRKGSLSPPNGSSSELDDDDTTLGVGAH